MARMNRAVMAVVLLVLVSVACRRGETERVNLFPSPTPDATQTPVYVQVTQVVQITVTPQPTAKPTMTRQIKLCVTAIETVYLRPSASENNYPVTTLTNGVEVVDKGGRDGEWIFVEVGDKQGWVYAEYIKPCQ
jgi:biopolymer transport protein ExbD